MAYFVSDIHLTSSDEVNAMRLLEFLRSEDVGKASHLFLVGDIFDLWIGRHKYFIEKFQPIVEALRQLQERGIEIHYFEGNHDLYLYEFWDRELGVHVHSGPQIFDLAGLKVRVEHGDEIDRSDRGYLILRWWLRTKFMRSSLSLLPSWLVSYLGERMSRASRHYTSRIKVTSQQQSIDLLRSHARQIQQRDTVDFIISGHMHVRDLSELRGANNKSFYSVNLGSWFESPMVFKLDETSHSFIAI